MNVSVRTGGPAPRSAGRRLVGTALVGVASFVIGASRLGLSTTVFLAATTVVVGVGGVRGWSWYWSHKRASSISLACGELVATATNGSQVGELRVLTDHLTWITPGANELLINESQIRSANLRRLPLVGATEMTLIMCDGTELSLTITAPMKSVLRSLSTNDN